MARRPRTSSRSSGTLAKYPCTILCSSGWPGHVHVLYGIRVLGGNRAWETHARTRIRRRCDLLDFFHPNHPAPTSRRTGAAMAIVHVIESLVLVDLHSWIASSPGIYSNWWRGLGPVLGWRFTVRGGSWSVVTGVGLVQGRGVITP